MYKLTEKQVQFYHSEGYLLVSGLIPQEIVEAGTRAMLSYLDDPSRGVVVTSPALTACYTSEILAAAAELAGEAVETFHAPDPAFPIISLPAEGEWSWLEAHIDHSIKADDYNTFPRPFNIASMLFLSDVVQHGGGTIVWPKSQAKLRALAESDCVRFEKVWALNLAMEEANIGEPLELTPKAGDILFYDFLLAHAGSKNITQVPRLGMNKKW